MHLTASQMRDEVVSKRGAAKGAVEACKPKVSATNSPRLSALTESQQHFSQNFCFDQALVATKMNATSRPMRPCPIVIAVEVTDLGAIAGILHFAQPIRAICSTIIAFIAQY